MVGSIRVTRTGVTRSLRNEPRPKAAKPVSGYQFDPRAVEAARERTLQRQAEDRALIEEAERIRQAAAEAPAPAAQPAAEPEQIKLSDLYMGPKA